MAANRPSVPAVTKRVLLEQTAGKCANPGCPNTLVQMHHIQEWHVYESHDSAHMICVCAACHDAIHRGELRIEDEDLYRWKGIDRAAPRTGHLFVEPGAAPRLLLGSMAAEGNSGLVVFDFAARHRLSFALRGDDIMLLNVGLGMADGTPALDVIDGYIRTRDSSIILESRPGRVRVPGRLDDTRFIPEWARTALLREDKFFGFQGVPLLDLAVVRPGVVKVEGVWLDEDRGVVVTSAAIHFLSATREGTISLVGAGEGTVLHFTGPVGVPMFGI